MNICSDCKHHGDVAICKECHDGDKYEKTKCSECAYWNNGGHDDHCTDCWGENFVPSQDAKFVPNQEAKADAGKLDLTLVPRKIIWAIAAIRRYGVEKYKEVDNWKRVEKQRYRAAMFRHFMAYLDDPTGVDEESGLPHLWHVATNCAFLCELEDINESDNH